LLPYDFIERNGAKLEVDLEKWLMSYDTFILSNILKNPSAAVVAITKFYRQISRNGGGRTNIS
jgi:hypothetical protein